MKFVNGQLQIDFDDFERRISHDTNTFILCNPQNPTGNCWSPEDLTAARRNLPQATAWWCSPMRFTATSSTRGSKYTPFASLPNKDVVETASRSRPRASRSASRRMKCAWFFSDQSRADWRASKAITAPTSTPWAWLRTRPPYSRRATSGSIRPSRVFERHPRFRRNRTCATRSAAREIHQGARNLSRVAGRERRGREDRRQRSWPTARSARKRHRAARDAGDDGASAIWS